jgi:hypothetical protein
VCTTKEQTRKNLGNKAIHSKCEKSGGKKTV